MKILITGDLGYLGENLKEFLKQKGCEVKGYDIADGKDILNLPSLTKAMKGCEYVYHCAAVSDIYACDKGRLHAYRINVEGAKNVVSTAYYVNTKPILFSSDKYIKLHMYGTTKRLIELLYEKKAVILRLSTVYGGEGYFEKKNTFITHLARDNPIKVYNGSEKRDFIHIDKVLEKCWEAMDYPSGIYNVYSGDQITVENLAKIVGTIRGVDVKTCV